ncbi:hypothetical protein AGMMS49587_15040 [Spirochaetia bacterium]|nr:hypothetical protein AGMMS49587_15040 [Spirochaetia bacterium]
MFGIGPSEIILVAIVLIILIKPEDLPKFLRSAGKMYGEIKRAYKEVIMVKDKIIREIDEAANLLEIEDARKKEPTENPGGAPTEAANPEVPAAPPPAGGDAHIPE